MTDEGERIVYPPLDLAKPFAPGLHVVDSGPHRAFGIPLPVRMTVIRLGDGGLLLHSPTRLTEGLANQLAAIGPVRDLLAPNVGHYAYVASWQAAFPDATTWAAPGMTRLLRLRGARLRVDVELGDAPPASWRDDLDVAVVPGGAGFREVLLFHRASRTLVLTDLVSALEPAKLPGWVAAGARATGAVGAVPRAPSYLRALVSLRRRDARAAVERLLALRP